MWVGKLRNDEIDFVAKNDDETLFIQVTEKMDWDINSTIYKREIGNLK
ncbi:MAG: hypothetical protein Ta2E_02160 [Mycoplasmoidaceae bacterium]|nr:MAG: hypothetical protein Ta2E_02160 [Mycoplasmoidaceae bacterium]